MACTKCRDNLATASTPRSCANTTSAASSRTRCTSPTRAPSAAPSARIVRRNGGKTVAVGHDGRSELADAGSRRWSRALRDAGVDVDRIGICADADALLRASTICDRWRHHGDRLAQSVRLQRLQDDARQEVASSAQDIQKLGAHGGGGRRRERQGQRAPSNRCCDAYVDRVVQGYDGGGRRTSCGTPATARPASISPR